SRLEGGAAAQREPVEVRALLEASARAFSPAAERAGAHLAVEAPAEMQASLDPELIRRMLDNLITNALRHVGRGHRIQLGAEAGAGQVTLAVRNSGPAIAESERGRIFEKYATGAPRTPERAGLGLYLCRLVAAAHGGEIALAQRPGWNVSFEAQLKATREA